VNVRVGDAYSSIAQIDSNPCEMGHMKNIQIIDGAENCVYDVFAATDEEYSLIFTEGTDVAFIDEVLARTHQDQLDLVFSAIWERRVRKKDAIGIHGTLFYELEHKKQYYPTRRDEDAINPDGAPVRA
jgi:hypothetical protein